jgi:hypothetical protein
MMMSTMLTLAISAIKRAHLHQHWMTRVCFYPSLARSMIFMLEECDGCCGSFGLAKEIFRSRCDESDQCCKNKN